MIRLLLFTVTLLSLSLASHAQGNGSKLDLNNPEEMAKLKELAKQFDSEYNEYKVRPRPLDANLDTTGEITTYLNPILRRIEAFPFPKEARGKLYGTVVVKFEISEFGALVGHTITRSSGHQELDSAAIEAVIAASPFPKFPSDLRKLGNILVVQRTFTFTHIPPQE